MLQQLYKATSYFVLIENNGAAWKWIVTPIWSDSIVALQGCHVVDAGTQWKLTLKMYDYNSYSPNKYSSIRSCSINLGYKES